MDACLEQVMRAVLDLPVGAAIRPDQELESALGVDSLFLMSIVVGVEAERGIELSAASIGSVRTVGDLDRAVGEALGAVGEI
ncbi:acyl carrier protein [Kribbella sp. CA-293567]|uniref:acyl carrier protein n=1 Tax=Kribbella sp. CA-293567 TaxID=3002436 RepID=UPI0022DD70BA|nr:acyl carrier protein [Kribbella sp. CA-293567]WBQ07606.1 acyl carrier protein [Kribbella sp. CA-293567]